jgi:hypothetical protein
MNVTLRVLLFIAVISRSVAIAQERQPQPPNPPAGSAAWSLLVYTTGGFTGSGVGSVTISSDGQVTCALLTCATPITTAQLRSVATTLASIVDGAWIRTVPSSFCRDCVQTTVVFKRREGDVIRTSVATWDDSQVKDVAPELRELRRLAFDLRSSR